MVLKPVRFVFLSILALDACAGPAPIVGIGMNTYAVNEAFPISSGGSSAAMADTLMRANQFCMQYDRHVMLVTSAQGGNGAYNENGDAYFGMTFRCLLLDDPDFTVPTAQASAGILPVPNDNYVLGIDVHGAGVDRAAGVVSAARGIEDDNAPDLLKLK